MAFVITSPCINEKTADCVDVCPVDCIEEGEDMFVIDPDLCIDCGACEHACPVEAIYNEENVPPEEKKYINMAYDFFT